MNEIIPDLIGIGAREIIANANRLGLVWQMRLATVINGDTPPQVSATYDGDSDAVTMTSMVGGLAQGARVFVLEVPPGGNYITGCITPSTGLGANGYNNIDTGDPNTGSTTSGSYADMPGPMSFTLHKYHSYTRLRLFMSGTWFESTGTAGTSAGFGLEVSGPGVATGDINMSAYNATIPPGVVRLPIPTAERYATVLGSGIVTITARWVRNGGTGTISVAAGADWLCMSAAEVP